MKKKKLTEKILEYTVIFEPAQEGGYVASVPVLPGCVTQGDTFEESVVMVKDAIELYLDTLAETGEDIPKEKPEIVITKVGVSSPHYPI